MIIYFMLFKGERMIDQEIKDTIAEFAEKLWADDGIVIVLNEEYENKNGELASSVIIVAGYVPTFALIVSVQIGVSKKHGCFVRCHATGQLKKGNPLKTPQDTHVFAHQPSGSFHMGCQMDRVCREKRDDLGFLLQESRKWIWSTAQMNRRGLRHNFDESFTFEVTPVNSLEFEELENKFGPDIAYKTFGARFAAKLPDSLLERTHAAALRKILRAAV